MTWEWRAPDETVSTSKALLTAALAVLCFHAAYSFGPLLFPQLFIVGYAIGLVQLARLASTRKAFYLGLLTGFLCFAPQLVFFWEIFSAAAVVLWLILAFWIALFVALAQIILARFGPRMAVLLLPFLWTGLEYTRSELYYLKFSWLNIGYALAGWEQPVLPFLGMYGVGFLVVAIASGWLLARSKAAVVTIALLASFALLRFTASESKTSSAGPELRVAGVQLEFPAVNQILSALDILLASHPDAQLVVLSEYTLDGPVPDSLKAWCRKTGCYLIVGGKDAALAGQYFNTAFVVSPAGKVVFSQAKSVPIPFFNDGFPALRQSVWNSPWGKIGICICYDLSYRRVTDELIRQGAQMLVVPTMDVAEWGAQEHASNARVAPVRAAEYGVPIFRLASSGISEAVNDHGKIIARTTFPGPGEMLFAAFHLPSKATLPHDRWFAPLCVLVTALLGLFLVLEPRIKRGRSRMTLR